jgi:hypothetical protein
MNMHLPNTAPAANEFLSGRTIAKRVRGRPLHERLVVAMMMLGDTPIGALTHAQIASLANVGTRSVSIIAGATIEQRRELFSGRLSLRAARRARATKSKRREPTYAELEAFIERDPNLAYAIFEKFTAPPLATAV